LKSLKVLYLTAHSGCDCRCIMCDIWKADQAGVTLDVGDIRRQIDALKALQFEYVVLSGGEPLKHENLRALCQALREASLKIVVFSTGMLLELHAEEIVRYADQVTVSLDGTPPVHDRIRQVNGCADKLSAGIRSVLQADSGFPIAARTVVQKQNCGELHEIVRYARELNLRGISFVAADVSSTAFNRPTGWDEPKISQVALSHCDLCKLSRSIELLLTDYAREFERQFILTTPRQLWDIYRYYKALLGQCDFPPVRCNAPWSSAVLDPDGTLRPCFFHEPYGNAFEDGIENVINGREAVRFRRQLRVTKNEICRGCIAASSRTGLELIMDTGSEER
jgi:Fe-coproporphyrin III synthase